MSATFKRGVILSVEDHTTYDYFVDRNVCKIVLLNEQNEEYSAKYIPAEGFHLHDLIFSVVFGKTETFGEELLKFDDDTKINRGRKYQNDPFANPKDGCKYFFDECLFRPSIGDTVEIMWDNGNYDAKILTLADNRVLISRNLPEFKKTSPSIQDIIDSLEL